MISGRLFAGPQECTTCQSTIPKLAEKVVARRLRRCHLKLLRIVQSRKESRLLRKRAGVNRIDVGVESRYRICQGNCQKEDARLAHRSLAIGNVPPSVSEFSALNRATHAAVYV